MPSKKIALTILASLALIGCLATTIPTPDSENPSTDQIAFQEISVDSKHYLVATIDPDLFQLNIVENSPPPESLSIKKIQEENKAVMAFNGSFYAEDFRPLGLLVSSGKLIFPFTKSQLMNGVFTIDQDQNATLYTDQEFQDQQTELLPTISFAIQAGPILIDRESKIAIDKKNNIKAGRTALGLDKDNNIVLIMLRQSLLNQENAQTLYDFTETVSSAKQFSNLGLHSLINLDGGNSSGVAINDRYFPELEKVQHIITVSKIS
jgi:uncharacterized protein YigE (DUF2233 family)